MHIVCELDLEQMVSHMKTLCDMDSLLNQFTIDFTSGEVQSILEETSMSISKVCTSP